MHVIVYSIEQASYVWLKHKKGRVFWMMSVTQVAINSHELYLYP